MPFGPPPEEYVYRCGVCGLEDLVNEAIIDVVVAEPNSVVNTGVACLSLSARSVAVRRWNTSIKRDSPTEGR
jgi:hypothetical protein